MGQLDNKVIIVTGATSGIGRTSAVLFAKEGAKVSVVGRRSEEGLAVVKEIEAAGGKAIFIKANVSQVSDIERTVQETVEKFGRLDGAFNNAGIGGGRGGIETRNEAEWQEMFEINAKSAFFGLQAQVAQFRKQKSVGSILFNASVLASVGFPGTVMYGASKGTVVTIARSAAVELGPEGIRVNTISPSITRTPMTESRFVKQDDGTEAHPMAALTPLRRVAEPLDIAHPAMFLLSDFASFITGQDLIVDGGISAA